MVSSVAMDHPAPHNDRNRQILAAIVRAYIETGEPVSSRTISTRHVESLSSATVRNVMADLEEAGFLYQPHTSAGRVPTATAYRFFAQQVAARATLSPEDEEWIRGEFAAANSPRIHSSSSGLNVARAATCCAKKRYAVAVGTRPAEVCGWYRKPASSKSAITLRTVAELSDSTCRVEIVREETGSPVSM